MSNLQSGLLLQRLVHSTQWKSMMKKASDNTGAYTVSLAFVACSGCKSITGLASSIYMSKINRKTMHLPTDMSLNQVHSVPSPAPQQ